MALGGGTFTFQNKVLPGAYINFVSASSASANLSERGIATMPLELDWGKEHEVFEVTSEDFQTNSVNYFGYSYDHEKLKGLRDLFLNAKTLYAYRLNSNGTKADCDYATALFGGERGNDLKIVIQANADTPENFDVSTYLDSAIIDTQTVANATELVDNEYVTFKTGASLQNTAGTPLTGGTNGTVDGSTHQEYLKKIESYNYNTMGVVTTDSVTKKLYTAFNKRLRDEQGVKMQLVLHQHDADYMGVISVDNKVTDLGESEASLVYWVTGAECSCEVNQTLQNKKYDGEFSVNLNYTQSELSEGLTSGKFLLHGIDNIPYVLDDINSMVTTSDTQGEDFKSNQTVRVLDQIGNDIAVMFRTKFLGKMPNDAAGRIALWSSIVAHHRELEKIRAIENFSDSEVTVTQGNSKKSVVISDQVTVVNAMSKLYMNVVVN